MTVAIATLWQREIVRFYRQRSRIVGALATPVLFWLVLGSGFDTSFQSAGGMRELDYAEYFFPGTIVLVILFTAIFSTISVIEDRKEGFLQAVLVAPVPRSAIVLGKVLGGSTLALGQALLLLLAAPLAGLSPTLGGLLGAIAMLAVIAIGLTTLGFMIAWKMDSTQGFHAVMNLLLIPMWLLSGAFFPAAGASPGMEFLMRLNPLTYGMASIRWTLDPGSIGPDSGIPSLAISVLVTCTFTIGAFLIATRMASAPLDPDLA